MADLREIQGRPRTVKQPDAPFGEDARLRFDGSRVQKQPSGVPLTEAVADQEHRHAMRSTGKIPAVFVSDHHSGSFVCR